MPKVARSPESLALELGLEPLYADRMRVLSGLGVLLLAGAACTRSGTKEHHELAPSAAATPSTRIANVGAAAAQNIGSASPVTGLDTASAPSAGSASPDGLPQAAVDASSPAPSAASAKDAAADTVQCKALGQRGLVPIGTIAVGDTFEPLVDLMTESGNVIAATYYQSLAKFTVTTLRRDGAPAKVVGAHTTLGEPRSPIWTADAVYFTRNRTLWRMSRTTGAVTELVKEFSHGIGIEAGYVYGVDCDSKVPIDRMQRIAVGGGALESLVDFERKAAAGNDLGQRNCDYRALISDGQAIYAAHWNGRRIIRYSLAERTVQEFLNKKPFPSRLLFVGSDLVFQAATGIFRSPKATANVKRVSDLGQAPYGFIAANEQFLVIDDVIPYAPDEWLYVLPWSKGKARKLEYFKALNPDDTPPDIGIRGVALDDQCLYVARQLKTSLVIYGRSLP